LSDGQFYRVGGHHPLRANVRVIAATHQNLEDRVRQGVFREDLFHRLNVIRLRLPALRERPEDIPMLARHFLARSAKELGVEAKRITDAALQRLAAFQFPGNVRQLENICHWITVMAPAQVVEAKDLPPELGAAAAAGVMPGGMSATSAFLTTQNLTAAAEAAPASPSSVPGAADVALGVAASAPGRDAVGEPLPAACGTAADDWMTGLESEARHLLQSGRTDVWDVLSRRFEARLIQVALEQTRGRRIEAAQRLGIGRNTITRKLQELGSELPG
jgi:two-component system nitrogen regulation response regulator GlnG